MSISCRQVENNKNPARYRVGDGVAPDVLPHHRAYGSVPRRLRISMSANLFLTFRATRDINTSWFTLSLNHDIPPQVIDGHTIDPWCSLVGHHPVHRSLQILAFDHLAMDTLAVRLIPRFKRGSP